MSDLVVRPPDTGLVPASDRVIPPEAQAAVTAMAQSAWSDNTKRAYARGWKTFVEWCAAAGRQALPAAPETVIVFLTENRTKGVPTLAQAVAAIGHRHALAGFDPPPTASKQVQVVWKGIRRTKGTRARNAKTAITMEDLRAILAKVDRSTLVGKRDAAILLFGFWSAERRSEIMAAHAEHVTPADDGGIAVLIPQSKGDQEGEGQTIGLARVEEKELCPVAALFDWGTAARISSGPIFRRVFHNGTVGPRAMRPAQVAKVVKRYARAAGLDPRRFAGHSLRRGHVTEAIRQKVPDRQIMAQTRHKNATMLERYNAEANPVARGSTGAMKTRKP